MADRVREALSESGFSPKDLVKVVLKGCVDVTCEKNVDFILKGLEDRFFFAKVYDETKLTVDFDSFLSDLSLKGEFVRQVREAEDLDEETKSIVIRYGLQALAGEDIE